MSVLVIDSHVVKQAPREKFVNFLHLIRMFSEPSNFIAYSRPPRQFSFLSELGYLGCGIWQPEEPKFYPVALSVFLWRIGRTWDQDLVFVSDDPFYLPVLQSLVMEGISVTTWGFTDRFLGTLVKANIFSDDHKEVFLEGKSKESAETWVPHQDFILGSISEEDIEDE